MVVSKNNSWSAKLINGRQNFSYWQTSDLQKYLNDKGYNYPKNYFYKKKYF